MQLPVKLVRIGATAEDISAVSHSHSANQVHFALSFAGWQQFEALAKVESRTAFMAMKLNWIVSRACLAPYVVRSRPSLLGEPAGRHVARVAD
jgi:hypothetical protein